VIALRSSAVVEDCSVLVRMARFARACIDFAKSRDEVSWYGLRYMIIALSYHVCHSDGLQDDLAKCIGAEVVELLCEMGKRFLDGRYRDYPDDYVYGRGLEMCSRILDCVNKLLFRLCRSESDR